MVNSLTPFALLGFLQDPTQVRKFSTTPSLHQPLISVYRKTLKLRRDIVEEYTDPTETDKPAMLMMKN
jgi:hypothetical protein